MRILVIDDAPACRGFLTTVLNSFAWVTDVMVAETFAEGLELMPLCDVAIVDLFLPDATVQELLDDLTRRDFIPRVVCTGSQDDDVAHLFGQHGISFIPKRVDGEAFKILLANAIGIFEYKASNHSQLDEIESLLSGSQQWA